jgi:chemotaxis protein methyltransferase CheR
VSAFSPAAASTGAMNMIAALLEQRTGQQIAANRAWRIETALKPILRSNQFDTLEQLVAQLVATRDAELGDTVVDALLNQETSFFRDAGVLDGVYEASQRIQVAHPHRRLRIWCAGCSTGQEPLSLAMLFAELAKDSISPEPEIVATDVSTVAIARAKAGRYSQFEIQRGLPIRRMINWFDSDDNDWTARPALVRRINFRRQNLAADAPPAGRFDIILCRNVMLYFSPALRAQVFERLASAMSPGGLLVLGAGETVIGQTDKFSPCEEFRGFYRLVESNALPEAAAG